MVSTLGTHFGFVKSRILNLLDDHTESFHVAEYCHFTPELEKKEARKVLS